MKNLIKYLKSSDHLEDFNKKAEFQERNNSVKNGYEINQIITRELKEKFKDLNLNNLRIVGMNDSGATLGREGEKSYKRDLVSILVENKESEKKERITLPRNYCLDPLYFNEAIIQLKKLNNYKACKSQLKKKK